MTCYRIDFFGEDDEIFAMHELDYESDRRAIAGAYEINGDPTIGHGFRVWRDGVLVHSHCNRAVLAGAG
jgi:hypothetical protein